jgi:hypothetical protein
MKYTTGPKNIGCHLAYVYSPGICATPPCSISVYVRLIWWHLSTFKNKKKEVYNYP